MKVLYLIDSLQGYGAETSLVEITTRFKIIEPVFVQLYIGDQLKKELQEKQVSVYSLNLSGKYNFRAAVKKVLEIIEIEKPQIIHSTLFRSDIIARRIKKKLPHILLVGSLVNNSYSSFRLREMNLQRRIKHLFIKKWDRTTSRYVDFFISNSEAIIEPNIQALNIPREKIITINRGRDFSFFSRKKALPRSLPFDKTTSTIFLNVSRLENRKGHKDLINAFALYLISKPYAKLMIAGEGPERPNLEKLIKLLGVDQSVFLLGFRKDIPDLLRVADFFVFPSYYEGLPGALIEAVISKIPVIASNIPENRECLAPDSALLFSPGNITEIRDALMKANNMSDWTLKTKIAYCYAKEKFDINNISGQYEDFYIQIF